MAFKHEQKYKPITERLDKIIELLSVDENEIPVISAGEPNPHFVANLSSNAEAGVYDDWSRRGHPADREKIEQIYAGITKPQTEGKREPQEMTCPPGLHGGYACNTVPVPREFWIGYFGEYDGHTVYGYKDAAVKANAIDIFHVTEVIPGARQITKEELERAFDRGLGEYSRDHFIKMAKQLGFE